MTFFYVLGPFLALRLEKLGGSGVPVGKSRNAAVAQLFSYRINPGLKGCPNEDKNDEKSWILNYFSVAFLALEVDLASYEPT